MALRDGFTLGKWMIYPLQGRLVSGGEEQRVQPKSMDVLLCLVDAAGAVVERDTVLRQIWGERAQSDEPLTRCIGELRRALGDSTSDPEYILTVPKRGYRMLKAASEIDPVPIVDQGGDVATQSRAGFQIRPGVLTIVVLASIAVAIGAILYAVKPQAVDRGNASLDAQVVETRNPSIVVLPFLNLSSNEEQEYFSDGLTEELLNLLARFPELRVISRSSAFSYKGRNVDARTVAEELRVSHVLEGSVRRSGKQVRVTAQLINAASNTQLWSETYERTLDDIFLTQDDIAAKVADELKIQLLGDRPTIREHNPEAYALVLRARHLGRQFTPESFEVSIALLKQALGLDPQYASAWDELSRMYRRQAGQGLRPADEAYALSRNAANRALALDPMLASAHRSLAVISLNFDRDPVTAASHVERAYSVEPTNANSISGAASMAGALGRLGEAIALQEHAVARDPVNPLINTYLGTLYLHAGRFDEAMAAYQTTLILNPSYIGARFLLGESLLLKGDLGAALEAMQQEADEGYRLIGLVMVYHALGDAVASDQALASLIRQFEQDAPYNIAYTLGYRGEADRAFEWLDKAVAYNDPGLTEVATDPLFAGIRNDPRWLPFLESIGKSREQLAAIEFDITLPELP